MELLEIPIYRLNKVKFRFELDTIKKKNFNPDLPLEINERNYKRLYEKKGSWKFNEIIGYLKLEIDSTEQTIDFVFYKKQCERVTKKSRANIEFEEWFKEPCICINEILESNNPYEIIKNKIREIEKLKPLKSWHLDLDFFENIYRYVDWKEYIKSLNH